MLFFEQSLALPGLSPSGDRKSFYFLDPICNILFSMQRGPPRDARGGPPGLPRTGMQAAS